MMGLMNFFNKTKGSVSIFLTLIMLPMFVCAGLYVDGSRISAARIRVSGAGDLAMNAALSEYDQNLYDLYGIFAISENMDELQKNVTMYFRNSINNTGILNDSDSYSREFLNSIFSSFSSEDMNFGSIVDTQYQDFKLSGVPSSAIANPKALERQIIDYSKYRAPINLAKGLLEKIGCIGETSKQTKALDAKVEYDKELDTVKDACEEAYKAINEFNDLVNESRYKDNNYLTELNQDLEKTKKQYRLMAINILCANSASNFKVEKMKEDSSLKKRLENQIKNLSVAEGQSKDLAAYMYLIGILESDLKVEKKSNGKYEVVRGTDSYSNCYDAIEGYQKSHIGEGNCIYDVDTIKGLKSSYSGFQELYTETMLMKKYRDNICKSSSKESAETKDYVSNSFDVLSGYTKGTYEYYYMWAADQAINSWKKNATEYGKEGSKLLYTKWYSGLESVIKQIEKAVKALDEVEKKAGKLDDAREKWHDKITDLSDSEVKTSMNGEYENSAKDINIDAIHKLQDILNENKQYFESIKQKFDNIKFYGKNVVFSGYESADYYNRFSGSISKNVINSSGDIDHQADLAMNNYSSQTMTASSGDIKLITEDGEGMQFYKYLAKVCAKSGVKDSGKKEDAKDLKKQLIEKGNDSSSTTSSGLPEGMPKSIKMPEEVNKAISSMYDVEEPDNSDQQFDAKEVNSKENASNSDVADQNKENLSKISDLLSKLSDIAKMARDNLYVEEYLTEMFSCYMNTVKKDDKYVLSTKAMNGTEMTSNKFFGSEVEYILWGNENAQSNLNYTKALIFGIRFALNAIYAFTSSDTRTPALTAATAIAGWTGFGVPIVQTIILLAWGMAESFYDVDLICNKGESVALYKTKDTWFLGYGGIKSTLAKAAGEIAGKVIDDVFEKIEDIAVDASGKVIGNVESEVGKYADDTINGVYESVQGALSTPIEQLALQVAGTADSLNLNQISEKVENLLGSLKTNGSGLVNECINKAIDELIKKYKSSIASKLYEIYQKAQDKNNTVDTINELLYGVPDEHENYIGGLINDLKNNIRSIIQDKVDEYAEKFKTEIEKKIKEGGNKVKENLKDSINDFTSGIGGDSKSNGKSVSSGKGFTLNYKEYLKIFVMLHMVISSSNKDAMVTRAAKLMQINVSQKDNGFNIGNAYTVIQVSADVNVRTTFFSVPVTTVDSAGNTSVELDYSNIGTGWQKIKYQSVIGY